MHRRRFHSHLDKILFGNDESFRIGSLCPVDDELRKTPRNTGGNRLP